MDSNYLREMARIADWLAEMFWNTPTKEGIEGFNDLRFDVLECNGEGIAAIEKSVEGLTDEARKDIAVDYTSLFVGYRPECPHPYQSVYSSPERTVLGDTRDSVLEFYQAVGYRPTEDANEPEDHISHELWLLSYLYTNAVHALEKGDPACADGLLKKAAEFKDTYLVQWAPRFCDDINDQASTDFYRGVSRLLAAFCEA